MNRIIFVVQILANSPVERGTAVTFEPLGNPRVHVGTEVPLHRRRGRPELRLEQTPAPQSHTRIRNASTQE